MSRPDELVNQARPRGRESVGAGRRSAGPPVRRRPGLGLAHRQQASQALALALLLIRVTGSLVVSSADYDRLPPATYFVWLLLGMLLLRFVPEMVLVDVCGKGIAAATQALQFAGALGGLIGAVPPQALMGAANRFLLRQFSDGSFATAVHMLVDLDDGRYSIISAGHPPALRWCTPEQEWRVDNARGTALGITERPEPNASTGVLAPGEALLFYTDGVIESRHSDLDGGITWLRTTARQAVATGFDGAAHRIVGQVARGGDDRAVLVLARV